MNLCDNFEREAIGGKCYIGWREGVAATIEAHLPGLFKEGALAVSKA